NLVTLAALCLVTAMASGLAKLAVDATIQERIAERFRASAFAHSETVLMLAWVAGGALGLVPFGAWWGIALVIGVGALFMLRAIAAGVSLRREKLSGVASGGVPPVPVEEEPTTKRIPPRTRKPRGEPTTTKVLRTDDATEPVATTQVLPREEDEPETPGYHLYRPSGRLPEDDE